MTTLQAQERELVLGGGGLPRVNLLPPEVRERERLRRVRLGLGGAVLASFGVVGLLYAGAHSSVGSAEESLTAARAEQTRLQSEVGRYAEVTSVHSQTARAEAMLVQAMGDEVRWSRFLDDLSLSVPDRVWITSLSFAQGATATPTGTPTGTPSGAAAEPSIGTATLSGVARRHEDVAVWLETLAEQKGYGRPHLQSATEELISGTKVVNWTTTVPLTAEALSGRYSKAGS